MTGFMKNKLILFCICLVSLFLCRDGHVDAKKAVISDETVICLQCHSKQGVVFRFHNGETLSVYVNTDEYRMSVHNFLGCPDCHRGFSVDKHPKRRFRSRKQYKLQASLICRRCHKNDEIASKPIHASLLAEEKKGRSPVCADCHGAHSVMPVTGGKIFISEKKYCMGCHEYELDLTFKNGEHLLLKTDASALARSVHNKLGCSDCHYGFSSEDHPERKFRSMRDYSIASSDTCKRCHFDKYTKTEEGVHCAELNKGNINAPVCTDCHGSHAITRIRDKRTLIVKRCRNCHREIYEIYSKSVHGSALLIDANQDVPVCIDCHKAHDIGNPLTLVYREQIPEMCANCHANRLVMDKYGLSTDVVKSYLSDFHGITLGFYKKQRRMLDKPGRQIAVCTDCHGTHNIVSTRGVDIKELKAKLVKRCRKCHENVTGNFPDAWLSHYEPGIRKAPLVFLVNLFYKIFIPLMIAGLVLQIVLHIWRYIINR
ncbi:doubled CXXCH motif [bacterium BMS3Abin07]|nr:doubled CXXCH motif [bacterium BMS3Abin07]GBE32553.1 doubled CXXCH motif [bacterium BMS3Bbin05]HDO22251.1 hypothetical protein [Nitrospirota bacterium]HDZ88333.1 hypothetical protein [Nitrospirota bacterium]